MKRIVETPVSVEKVVEKVVEIKSTVVEQEGGLVTLLGKRVILMCMNYTYIGKLVGVNTNVVELEGAGICYETGEWNASAWKDLQKLPMKITYVQTGAIESFGEVSK